MATPPALLSPAAEQPSVTHVQPPPLPPRPLAVGSVSISTYLKNLHLGKAFTAGKKTAAGAASHNRLESEVGNANGKPNAHENAQERIVIETTRNRTQLLATESTKRNCKMTSVYFLDYYYDLISYLNQRKQRTVELAEHLGRQKADDSRVQAELSRFFEHERATLRERRTRLRVSAFQIVTQIGQGGYGQVYLVRKRDGSGGNGGEVMALKKMSKRILKRMGEVHHVITERDILARADSIWLVKLFYAFQDLENVYFAMEFVPGGDVRTLFNNSGVLIEGHARFYIAEMATAVSELHRLGFIHRDLKREFLTAYDIQLTRLPTAENFLIDKFGHIKLTDFGLSRGTLSDELVASLRTKLEKLKDTPLTQFSSQVGSPDYMAPEVLTKCNNGRGGYDLGVDWWSLGCILFEALCGYPPFSGPTTDDIWVNLYHWQRVLERPVYEGEDAEFNLSDTAWALVTRLIAPRRTRIVTLSELQTDAFFANYPFTQLRGDQTEPPFVPVLGSATDTGYFDDFSNPQDMAMYKEVQKRQQRLQAACAAGEKEAVSRRGMGMGLGMGMRQKGADGDGDGKLRQDFIGFTFKRRELCMQLQDE
ncbi:hypothetical protein HDU82_003900 [Entophlyctis luteolus]|nr:hypothetical protein HDU82_003900 [Entophlyctis luteolus]